MPTKKTLLFGLILVFSFLFSESQEQIYIDELGDTISGSYFQNKLRNKELLLSCWDSLGKSKKRYSVLRKNLYMKGFYEFNIIKKEVEKILSYKIQDSTDIIIEYYYKDDMCSASRSNNWTRNKVNQRKRFLNPIKKSLNSKDIIFICLFEKGIKLKNNPKSEKEYFFVDENDYFKKNIFISSTLCGSLAAIKPNGEVFIRNGEFRADSFSQYLKPKNWAQLFPTTKKD